MLKWIKVLSKLSKNTDILSEMDQRFSTTSRKMDQFLKDSQEVLDKLNAKYQENLALLESLKTLFSDINQTSEKIRKDSAEDRENLKQLNRELDNCKEQLKQKISEIDDYAKRYVNGINLEVTSCQENVSRVGSKLNELGEAIAEFQR